MESVGLQMEDIFGAEEEYNREDIGAEQNEVENTENAEDENTFQANIDPDTAAKLAKGAGKKVVRNPQPKLDPQRLAGQRGIAILPKLFENVKFKGKGYEEQDLEKVIKGLEHWAHRLFPKRTFEECLQIIERLGNKREVKTCIKKIRLDMPLLDEDFVSKPEEEVIRGEENNDQAEINEAESAFDEMMQTSTSSQFMSPPPSSQIPFNFSPSSQPNSSSKPKTVLSDELKEKIERNRRLALEKRAKKLQNPDISLSQTILSSQDEGKHSQVTETNLNATSKQSQILTDNGESSGIGAEATASGNDESVTSIDIHTFESPCDPTSPVIATKDSASFSGDEPSLGDKKTMSPICDKSVDMETTKSPCDPASPFPATKDSVSSSGDEPSLVDKRPISPICDKSNDMETTESPCDPASSIPSTKEFESSSADEPSSGDKKPMSPICDKSFDMETSESPCDPASSFPATKYSESSSVDEPTSDNKKLMSPICDKLVDMETSGSPCDPASSFPATKDSESSSVDEPTSDNKKLMSPICDKLVDIETSESPCDPASSFPATKDLESSSVDEPTSDNKKLMSPICDKLVDMETSESPCNPASSFPATKDAESSSVDEPTSG